ncbi:MAG: ABC transporter ATP-binding protein [Candidatus Magasanikbacteria bacterium]|jgi:ATP-binding cassette, subfamily B, bacterial|nr:ABC transporter ATP-binding protein [Candidatus Magasanikbacteria bacterium]MBT4071662.1 ABC transporter ATP-binding protein [Candidatus Magasanikbacteria bacterium]
MKYLTKKTLKIYLEHSKKYWFLFGLAIAAVIGTSIVQALIPLVYKEFFDTIYQASAPLEVKNTLFYLLFKVAGLYSIMWVLWRVVEFSITYAQSRTIENLFQSCFSYIHKHSFSFFQDQFIGSLVKKATRFTRAYEALQDTFVFTFVSNSFVVGTIIVVLAQRNILLTSFVVAWLVFFIVANILFSRFKLKYDIKRSKTDSKISAQYADTLTNNVNVKLFNGYGQEKKAFANITKEWGIINRLSWNLSSLNFAVQALLMIVLEVGMMYYAVILWERGLFTIGDFVLIQSYVVLLVHRIWDFGRVIRHWYERFADAEEMSEIFEMPHEIRDAKNAVPLEIEQGNIEFQDVTFRYRQTRAIMKDFNLKFSAGKSYALVGPSGAGKSTIVNLLLRQFDVTKGKILIDGQSTKRITQETLWRSISFVPQDPILFHRSLLENIRYGRTDATDEEVVEAAKAASCHEFVMNFPKKYKTLVGERGVKLSGGERQRVAIARAILRNAPILILDEATSSLDSESERLIQNALDKLMKGKTVIVIAHRLSTIMKMDKIIVVEAGKIKEEGTHKQLLRKKDGLYRRLWELQAGGFIA